MDRKWTFFVVISGKPSDRRYRSWCPKIDRVPVPVRSALRAPVSRTWRRRSSYCVSGMPASLDEPLQVGPQHRLQLVEQRGGTVGIGADRLLDDGVGGQERGATRRRGLGVVAEQALRDEHAVHAGGHHALVG